MPDDLSERIAEIAAGPAEVQGDQGRVKQQSIQDVIAADRYAKAQEGVSKNNFGMRRRKIVNPGM